MLGKAQPSHIYQNSFQCFITFPVSVPSSCVHQHMQDVPGKRLLPSLIYYKSTLVIESPLMELTGPTQDFRSLGANFSQFRQIVKFSNLNLSLIIIVEFSKKSLVEKLVHSKSLDATAQYTQCTLANKAPELGGHPLT